MVEILKHRPPTGPQATDSPVPLNKLLGISMFCFFCDQNFCFLLPLWKKTLFRFVFDWNTKTNKKGYKYFDIEKDFFKTFDQIFFCFLFFVFVWELFNSSKQNLLSTMNLLLSNWLNSMVVRLDISKKIFLQTFTFFHSDPRRFSNNYFHFVQIFVVFKTITSFWSTSFGKHLL